MIYFVFCIFVVPGLVLTQDEPSNNLYRSVNNKEQSRYDINKPLRHPELGMFPQYRDLVLSYISNFGGPKSHPLEFHEVPSEHHHSNGYQELYRPEDESGVPYHLRPSDVIILNSNSLNDVETKQVYPGRYGQALPPLGGVISDYILSRSSAYSNSIPNHVEDRAEDMISETHSVINNEKNDPAQRKRQIREIGVYFDEEDGVIVTAEKNKNEKKNNPNKQETASEDAEAEAQPAVAQSKPSAIALAGPGGVAQASPIGTALVGPGGIAVASPSGTAVAGSGQASIAVAGPDEKSKSGDKDQVLKKILSRARK